MLGLYTTLELAPRGEIRVISILPRSQSEALACEIQVVNLQDNPKYIALSYTWGSPTLAMEERKSGISTYSLLCKAKASSPVEPQQLWYPLTVTENLHAFLHKTRDDEAHAVDSYWIDAICINQEDPEERTCQVTMMATIYQSAHIVHAWLGEEDNDTGPAFELIKVLAKRIQGRQKAERINCLKDVTPKAVSSGELRAKHALFADLSAWKSMARFFQRTYFTRVWTIQEIKLARKLRALCGSHAVDWGDIIKVSEFLTLSPWTRWISDFITDSHHTNHAVPNILETEKMAGDLLYALIRCRRFMAGDPRDKVYALLGVVGDSVRGKSRLEPVYSGRSVTETYTLAAVQILEDSDDLLLLSCVEGSDPDLPSWVPDWRCNKVLGLGVIGYLRFSAAANLPRTLHINERDACLTVKGLCLDRITAIGESKRDILTGKPFPNWLSIFNALSDVYHTGQSRSEVFWRTLLTDTAGVHPWHPAPCSYRSAHVSWITSKLSEHTGNPTSANNVTSFAASETSGPLPCTLHAECRESSTYSIDSVDYETAFSHAVHLRLFLTDNQYLGLGSESIQKGDAVWILAGSRVPLILREVRPTTFRVVGVSYLHGFMDGEALDSTPLLSEITIE
ncbi:hypothetical protein PTT_18789 [Pyrenophora teres f. teres 0-1]|uniref:Heterokaryon incompatibility domain-containing protein n=1 Tax=Pyrenophora teres f. teres (strain 0-1) TaxID=861557 RepID=E3S7I4_PYRTT|nr:hypothetical protein PTT_18789 [Pyrenophora teres f. teres 0-1]